MGSHNPCSLHLKATKLQAVNINIACFFKPLRKYESGVKQFKTMLYSILYTLFNSSTTHEHRYLTSCLCTVSHPIHGYVNDLLFNQRP